MGERTDSLDVAVERVLARGGGAPRVAAPLGLGKPHRLINALYARVAADPRLSLRLYTALSLDPPQAAGELERRFLDPFVARHFGAGFPRLAYVEAQRRDALPANVAVEEFYLQSGALLTSTAAQRRHANLDYTHVARALVQRGIHCLVQRVAAGADGSLSLSCNTDLTFDVVDALVAAGQPRPLLVAEVDPALPWLGGQAAVDPAWFDVVVAPPGPHAPLFAAPRRPVGDVEHAIGLYASALVRDGGTLQIGIGALSDALCHALCLRQRDNATYRRVLAALDPELERHPAVIAGGGLGAFEEGLLGCSELLTDGFKSLVEAGVVRRRVVDDEAIMRRVVDGVASATDREALARGEYLRGAFYLGSSDFYAWLRNLDDDGRRGLGMRRVGDVNQLEAGHEALQRRQRRHMRCVNTCMQATALGAAASDQLADGRVVSGVGGQYNFVAMAHALDGARSLLLLRATRDVDGAPTSNVVWSHGNATIPRHLRDVFVSEYGIADLRDRSDEDCVRAMLAIADDRFAPGLVAAARDARKLVDAPAVRGRNTPEAVRAALRPFRGDGTLPDYPLGSDFTAVEQRLVRALAWLKAHAATSAGKLRTAAAAFTSRGADDAEALERMGLAAPTSATERLYARLLRHALAASAR